MSRWDLRSPETRTARGTIGALLRSAGLAAARPARRERAPAAAQIMERLEDRVMLAGDEPNIEQVFSTPSPLPVPEITLDGFGVGTGVTGSGSSVIDVPTDTDVFFFTAPANDFVRVWADSLATGSTLDSRIEVYTGTPGGTPTLVASGSNNGTLTSGVFKDGWAGFVATAGTEYYVVVRPGPMSGLGSIGDYTLRINAVSAVFPALDAGTGEGSAAGNLTVRGGDVVYRVTTGAGAAFDSLATFIATADPTDLDPRLDIYAADGTPLVSDSDTGNLTDAYAATRSGQSKTFYVRVRSDDIGDPVTEPSTGAFTLNVDGIARNIALDPVTRRGEQGGLSLGDQHDTELLRFLARGTGLSFITVNVGVPFGLPDSAVRIYNDAGTLIGFNELSGAFSRLEIQLVGGQNYYVVVENFDGTAGGAFVLEVEAHHTYNATLPVDDHVNTPSATLPVDVRRREFELATPIIWGSPVPAPTPVDGIGLPDPSADHQLVLLGEATGRIHTAADTDLFQFVPPVDMLGDYPGYSDPRDPPIGPVPPETQWVTNFRPASRLQVLSFGGTMENTRIRVFDSNLALVYDFNNRVLSAFPEPAGMLDPAAFPPTLPVEVYGFTFSAGQPGGIKVWGGEVYYIEVSSESGSGRYDFTVQVDAPTDGVISDFGPELPGVGGFGSAYEIQIDANDGEGRNYNNVAGGSLVETPPGSGIFTGATGNGSAVLQGRVFADNLPLNVPDQTGAGTGGGRGPGVFQGRPGTKGRAVLQMSDLGVIQSPTDADLYQFRAIYTGTAEIRINTTNLTDEFWEGIANTDQNNPTGTPPVLDPPVLGTTNATKTYNSPLDSALRVFDNDQVEIAYNNDNGVTAGESDGRAVGSFTDRTFQRRDARVVIPVEAGKIYFVQVESGQRENFNLTFPKVDWRRTAGSYELLINSMPNLNFIDDHINFTGIDIQATPIPVDLDNPSATAVLGSVDGQISNSLTNPDDSDLFTFFSPAEGTATITVSTRLGDSFDRVITVYDQAGTQVTQAFAGGTDDGVVQVLVNQGDRFYVSVSGDQGSEGRYTIKVSGVPLVDDNASDPFFFGATEIPKDLYDYDGTETIAGSIENPGDSDVFTFNTISYDTATITVTALDAGLRPLVRIFEVGEDGAANPVLMHIAFRAAAAAGGSAEITFSLTAPPRTSGGNGDTFNSYYVLVSGADPDLHAGNYNLTLTVNNTTDDHPDATQYDIASVIDLDDQGNGAAAGVIELSDDTDLFQFVSGAQGTTVIQITSPSTSLLFPRVRIFDAAFQPVQDAATSAFFVTGPDQLTSVAEFRFTALRDQTYYVQVEGVTPFGNTFKTANVGSYLVGVVAPFPDDHPNQGEFSIATNIPISAFTGDGISNGQLEFGTDTDLFKFTSIVSGTMEVTIDTPSSQFTPVLRFFSSAPGNPEIGAAATGTTGSVTRNLAMVSGTTYYILVSSDPAGLATIGGYSVTLIGTNPPLGPDDHPDAGDFNDATVVPLEQLTGDATASGNIEIQPDTDLFVFNSLAGSPSVPRAAFVQVVPSVAGVPRGIRIFTLVGGIHQEIASSFISGPGYSAQVKFDIDAPSKKYWILVDGQSTTGAYTVKIDTAPETYFLYYPEGFANANIREYISIGNDNDFDVPYTIRLRYESNDPELVISGVAMANRRGGITISDGTANPGTGVLFNKPYAIIIESGAFLAANISHYDFGNTLGEAFTGRTSSNWSFAQAERFPGTINDFILYYNPNPHDVVVTLTAYQTDPDTGVVTTYAMSQTVQAFRRFGWNVNATGQLPLGKFAFTLTSANAPAVPAGTRHLGIVAALSHNDLAQGLGYAVLGNPDSGATAGVIPGLISTSPASPHLTLFNSSATPATVGLIGRYINSGIPDFISNITLAPFESRSFTAVSLGLVPNQIIGLRYDSNTRITALGGTDQHGASDVTQAATDAGTSWYFGDAFINRKVAGSLYFENMYFYNPDTNPLPVTLNFYFNNSDIPATHSFIIGPKDFATVALHTLPAILNHAVFNWFSVKAEADRPFSAMMNHYDLVLSGGWGTKGAPLGITNPISTI